MYHVMRKLLSVWPNVSFQTPKWGWEGELMAPTINHHPSWLLCLIMVPLTHPFPSTWFVVWALKLVAVDLQILLVIIFGVWCVPACCACTINLAIVYGFFKTYIFQGMLARDSNLWARAFTEDFASEISHIPNITAPSREIFNRIGTQTNQLWGW